jgi:hypothetical protein
MGLKMDSNLLISVISGLGRWSEADDGQPVYIKDDDCVGKDRRHILRIACAMNICHIRWVNSKV